MLEHLNFGLDPLKGPGKKEKKKGLMRHSGVCGDITLVIVKEALSQGI